LLRGVQKWIVGKQYPIIPGELFYMSIRNEAKLRELQDWQVKSPPKLADSSVSMLDASMTARSSNPFLDLR
jgi:hypothetical protein